jgi:hypothetical protein
VTKSFRKSLSAGLEGLKKAGFLFALVAGSAGLGLLIAWPLWFFATSARQAYTITVLCLGGVFAVFLVVRAARRRRAVMRQAGKPRSGLLSIVLTVLIACVATAGAFVAAALFARGLWVIAAIEIVLWGALLWLIGRARRSANSRKVRPVPAENTGK